MASYHSLFLLQLVILLYSSLLPSPISSSRKLHKLHDNHSFSQHASTCKPYKPSNKNHPSTTLPLFHRYGPCSPLNQGQPPPPLSKILSQDIARVRSIQARVRGESNTTSNLNDMKVNLPATLPPSLGNYLVSVGLGTPPQTVSLAFDTGSHLTWTQCQPCPPESCYTQNDPIFDPSSSTTYSTVACDAVECSQSAAATGRNSQCSETSCTYLAKYGDQSMSMGLINKDTITLSTDTLPDFVFGCSQEARGNFGTSAGLLGLGKNRLSVISQTSQKYNNYFSYCLPSTPSSTGHLTLGQTESSVGNGVAFTPLVGTDDYYFIELVGITVNKQPLSIDSTILSSAKTIIDSGTVITRLPLTAYTALREAFKEGMTEYTQVEGNQILDTCYDLSNIEPSDETIPEIALTFGGEVVVDIKKEGILFFGDNRAQVCLAFAANSDDGSEPVIIGNTQQRTYDVVYDVAGGKLGFSKGGCE